MPPFPRLGRHNNRSQQALVDSPPAASVAAAAGGGTGEAILSQSQTQSPSLSPNQYQPQGQIHPLNHHPQTHPHGQNLADTSPVQSTGPPIALSTNTSSIGTADSPTVDPRSPNQPQPLVRQPSPSQQLTAQQPQLQTTTGPTSGVPLTLQNQQPYTVSPEQAAIHSPVFEGHRPQFVDPSLNRSQTQRFSTYASIPPQQHPDQQNQQHLRHQLAHGVGSTSLEDLPASAGTGYPSPPQPQLQQQPQPQPSPAPEKKSRRKLIKGILFSGTSRSNNEQQQSSQHQGYTQGHHRGQSSVSYENTGKLLRRQSQRVNTLPVSQAQSPIASPHPDREWHSPGTPGYQSIETSPLYGVGEVDEYQYQGREPEQVIQSPVPQHHIDTSVRLVNSDLASSPYDETYQGQINHQQQQQQLQEVPPPHQPHLQQHQQPAQVQSPLVQPHVQAHHPQDQAHGYDQTRFEQQQQPPYHLTTAAAPPPQYQHANEQHPVPSGHPTPVSSLLQQNSDAQSLVSHDSPIPEPAQRAPNNQSPAQIPPAAEHPARTQQHGSTPNPAPTQQANPSAQQSVMPPPPGAPPSGRRGQEPDKVVALRNQAEVPPGPPPGYRHSNSSAGALNPGTPGVPQAGQPAPPNPAFASGEHGRHSPQPEHRDVESEKVFKDLATKYKNVKRLYFDGKAQIENLGRQVEQLQNAVANQRMSQSRTALDDSEYSSRFNRLNGAINNLAFNIRKDWRVVPSWLVGYVSADALKTGKQEMTAVGRAVISQWLMDEIFDRVFHPGLDPVLSSHLKEIELNIRGNAYTMNSQEEFDALTTKIVHWRMATLDGLHKVLNSSATTEQKHNLTTMATSNLTASLYQFLNEPPPPGVEGSASMIVELAIGITANLPLESRDVCIVYPQPGDIVQPAIMEVEKTPLPSLEGMDADSDSDEEPEQDKAALRETRVRFAGFPALEVRGRQVLMKAPVWTL